MKQVKRLNSHSNSSVAESTPAQSSCVSRRSKNLSTACRLKPFARANEFRSCLWCGVRKTNWRFLLKRLSLPVVSFLERCSIPLRSASSNAKWHTSCLDKPKSICSIVTKCSERGLSLVVQWTSAGTVRVAGNCPLLSCFDQELSAEVLFLAHWNA